MQSTPSIWRCLLHVSKVTNIKCCSSTQLFLYIDTTIGSFSKQDSFTLFPSFSCINSRCAFILNKRFKKEKHVYCIINTGRGFAAKWRSQHAKSGASRFPLRQIPVAMAPCFPKAAAPHRRRRSVYLFFNYLYRQFHRNVHFILIHRSIDSRSLPGTAKSGAISWIGSPDPSRSVLL